MTSRLTRAEKMPYATAFHFLFILAASVVSCRMLIAFSGSVVSATLLHLSADLLKRSFMDKPTIGHIDVSCVFSRTPAERDAFLDRVRAACSSYGYECQILPLEDILLEPAAASSSSSETPSSAEARQEKIRSILESAGSLTAKEDLYSHMLRSALAVLAKRLKFAVLSCFPGYTMFITYFCILGSQESYWETLRLIWRSN